MQHGSLLFKYLSDNSILTKNVDKLELSSDVIIDNSVIKKIEPKNVPGESICKLVSSFDYAYEYENVLSFAEELLKNEELIAVAVVGYDNKVKGIILRKDFSDIIGKPYGRDIYKNNPISSLMKECYCFYEDESILNVSEKLKEELREVKTYHYIVIDKDNEFLGIFSTKSILIYLSEITQKDLLLAERLQKRIVKDDFYIKEDNIEISAISRMAKEVGGDFYTIKKVNEDKYLVAIFDISGKGISASLLTSLLGGMSNTYDFNRGLKNFAFIVNRYIFKTFELEKYATGILFLYNNKTNDITLYDAGHSYIYIFRNKRFHKLKTNSNLPIGVAEKIEPQVTKVKLRQDDIVFLFTDGLIEQKNSSGVIYSMSRVNELFNKYEHKGIDELKNILIDDINEFKKNNYQQDDISFIIFKVNLS